MPSETDVAADLVICADLQLGNCCCRLLLLLALAVLAQSPAAAGQYVANLQIVYPFPYTTLGALLSHLYRATSSIQICSAAQAACCFASTFMPEMHKRVTTQRPLVQQQLVTT